MKPLNIPAQGHISEVTRWILVRVKAVVYFLFTSVRFLSPIVWCSFCIQAVCPFKNSAHILSTVGLRSLPSVAGKTPSEMNYRNKVIWRKGNCFTWVRFDVLLVTVKITEFQNVILYCQVGSYYLQIHGRRLLNPVDGGVRSFETSTNFGQTTRLSSES